MKNPLRELLNKILWDPKTNQQKYFISFKDFERESGVREIPGMQLITVDGFGMDILGGDYIPFHRIKRINSTTKTMYEN
jgi:uncharacterized protein (UPF0248 family)